jgi:hypothetical protein
LISASIRSCRISRGRRVGPRRWPDVRNRIDLRDDQTRRCSAGTCAVDGSLSGHGVLLFEHELIAVWVETVEDAGVEGIMRSGPRTTLLLGD